MYIRNSGGPLLNKGDNSVIGRLRGTNVKFDIKATVQDAQKIRPLDKQHKLQSSIDDWLRGLLKEVAWADEQDRMFMPKIRSRFFGRKFGELTYYTPPQTAKDTFSRTQATPSTSPGGVDETLFNRTDIFAVFTGSLGDFFDAGAYAFRFTVQLHVTTRVQVELSMTPSISTTSNANIGRPQPKKARSKRRNMLEDGEFVSTYEWKRTFFGKAAFRTASFANQNPEEDLKAPFKALDPAVFEEDLPFEIFIQPSGMCAIDKVHCSLGDGRFVEGVKGSLRADYIYTAAGATPSSLSDPWNAVTFINDLEFMKTDNSMKSWEAHVGLSPWWGSKGQSLGVRGTLWSPPVAVHVPTK